MPDDQLNTSFIVASDSNSDPVEFSYAIVRFIAKGNYGNVHEVRVENGERTMAMKTAIGLNTLVKEESILRRLNHPNIVKLEYTGHSESMLLVLELMPTNLHSFMEQLKQEKKPFEPLLVKMFLYQICRGLAHMHSLSIMHRDLKPTNILIDPKTGVLKICDFGSAELTTATGSHRNQPYLGCRYYRAFELLVGDTQHFQAVDIWSMGTIFGEMIKLGRMFEGEDTKDMLSLLTSYLGPPSRLLMERLGAADMIVPKEKVGSIELLMELRIKPDQKQFLLRLLRYDPHQRPTAETLMRNEFFAELKEHKRIGTVAVPTNLFEWTDDEGNYPLDLTFTKFDTDDARLISMDPYLLAAKAMAEEQAGFAESEPGPSAKRPRNKN